MSQHRGCIYSFVAFAKTYTSNSKCGTSFGGGSMNIRKGTGSTVLLNISGNDIREGTGSKVLFNLSGNNIRKGTGSTTLYNTTDRFNTLQLAAILFALNEV